MEQGIVIFLNGVSSSGKSSISNQLVNLEKMKFYHLSIDDFCEGLFHSYVDFFNTKFPNLEPSNKDDEQYVVQIMRDPLISIYFSTIKLFSSMGKNVVVDTVLDNEKWLNMCIDLLKDHPTLFVGVKCSLEELVRRENQRGDRIPGLAVSQYNKVHTFGDYDLELNTDELSPGECASHIIEYIEMKRDFNAFKKLTKK